ncbi:MAG: non-homologous end-joining DNA ligase [Nocardioidaceae bacterium]
MRPMLATRGTTVPTGAGWQHEVKWDGIRLLAEVRDGRLRLTTRNENDVTADYPEFGGLAALGHDFVLDGEAVALVRGRQQLSALGERTGAAVLMVFDVLAVDGHDVTAEPLSMRRKLLEALELDGPAWQTSPGYDDGPALLDATREQGLEGIVSKRLSSAYLPGRRSEAWLKFPHRPTRSYVVGGYRPEVGSRSRLGAVLVGEPTSAGLAYRGRVGAGLAGKAGQRLRELLVPLSVPDSPFAAEVPDLDAAGATWVRPEVVIDVESLGLTDQGRLRQSAYQRVRRDIRPADLATDGRDG